MELTKNNKRTTVTDIDGNIYNTVKIGIQEWTTENLKVEHYRNGDVISHIQNTEEWNQRILGSWCYYENELLYGETYGKLYNYYAVNDPRGLAPEGWHIPNEDEWTKLTDFLGGKNIAGIELKTTSTTLWKSPNLGATNKSKFSALPGGGRFNNGEFTSVGELSGFWSSSEGHSNLAWLRYLYYSHSVVTTNYVFKTFGLSVRCIKD